ncbi:helix-turn-helix domain-containing protein [Pseudoroseomonas globiformis]|uniref:Helix-turn-helix domain-containing protein n=1 Tax=Teichococcus globiformis TaxID=2307229 RepID=A0ABV7G7D0_9PROT
MTLTIGELSRRTGVKPTTIRWYEQEGLLPSPARSDGGHRVYAADHLRRLGFIRHARELGFAMPAIRTLLGLAGRPREDCAAIHGLATAQIAEVDSRLRRLEALRAELVEMAGSCRGGEAKDCRILETLADFEHGHCHHHAVPMALD